MSRYEWKLDDELLEKAVLELNEPRDNTERLKAIDELRNSFDSEQYGSLLREDDAFILRFLRAKKFNKEKALDVLHHYHLVRKEFDSVFDKVRNPTLLRPMMEAGVLSLLPGTSYDGAAVVFYRPGVVENLIIYEVVAYAVVTIEKLLEDERNQICGVGALEDMEGLSIKTYFQVSPFQLKRLNSIWQNAMPIRFKSIHIVNEGKLFDAVLALFRQFLNKKVLKRIFTYSDKYQQIHDHIDPSILPPYLGGSGPDPNALTRSWISQLTEDWSEGIAL